MHILGGGFTLFLLTNMYKTIITLSWLLQTTFTFWNWMHTDSAYKKSCHCFNALMLLSFTSLCLNSACTQIHSNINIINSSSSSSSSIIWFNFFKWWLMYAVHQFLTLSGCLLPLYYQICFGFLNCCSYLYSQCIHNCCIPLMLAFGS